MMYEVHSSFSIEQKEGKPKRALLQRLHKEKGQFFLHLLYACIYFLYSLRNSDFNSVLAVP
jgi:hypothetical protein